MANQYLSKIKIPGITDALIIKDTEAHTLISQLDEVTVADINALT